MKKISLTLFALLMCSAVFSQTLVPVANKKGLWGYTDSRGKFVIKAKFQDAGNFSEGLAYVKSGNKYGYISELGQLVIPAIYDSATPFINNLAICSQNGKFGVIKNDGHEIIPFKYSSLESSANHSFYLGKIGNDQSTFVILSDNSSHEYDEINFADSSYQMIPVKKGNLIGFIDNNGIQVVAPIFSEIGDFKHDTIAIAKTQDGYGLINHKRKMISDFVYSSVQDANGFYIMKKSANDYDLINAHGKKVIEGATSINLYGNVIMLHNKGVFDLYLPGKGYIFADKDNMIEEAGIISTVDDGVKKKYNTSNGLMAVEANGQSIWTPSSALGIFIKGNIIVWIDAKTKNYSLMSISGKPIFSDKEILTVFSSNCVCTQNSDGFYLYDANEKQISGPFERIYKLGENHIVVCKTVKRELTGAVLYLPTQKMLTDFILPRISEDRNHNIICSAGKIAASLEKVYVLQGRGYEDTYVAVDTKTKKKGLFNLTTNKLIVSTKYDEVYDIDEWGNATTYIVNKGYGLINSKGTVILSNQYLNAPSRIANAKHYMIYDNYGGVFYIDVNGKRVSEKEVNKVVYESRRNVGF